MRQVIPPFRKHSYQNFQPVNGKILRFRVYLVG